jgi:hypothetical protein
MGITDPISFSPDISIASTSLIHYVVLVVTLLTKHLPLGVGKAR